MRRQAGLTVNSGYALLIQERHGEVLVGFDHFAVLGLLPQ